MKALGRNREVGFNRVVELGGRKEKARMFYDLLSMVNDGKIIMAQSRPLADITITVT